MNDLATASGLLSGQSPAPPRPRSPVPIDVPKSPRSSSAQAQQRRKNQDKNVAIKMVPKAFADEIDAKRILREIKLLKHFRHENVVSILDMMTPNVAYLEDFNDVYIVTDHDKMVLDTV